MNKQALLQGMTQPEERLLFAKVLDQDAFSYKRHTPAFTDFLDMAKSGKFLEKLRSLSDLNVVAFGGTEDCERRMLGFVPDYMELEGKDFPICALSITKHRKIGQTDLSHLDYLDNILDLGLDRGEVGDILVSEEQTICYVSEEIVDYILVNLEKVSRTPVQVEKTDLSESEAKKEIEVRRLTVASVRLDDVAGGVLHLSRGRCRHSSLGKKPM